MDISVKIRAIEIVKVYLSHMDNEYHNMEHTKTVVKNALELAEFENLTEKETQLVEVASWYHDIGHLYGHENHEEKSANIATHILEELDVDNEEIIRINNAIRATNYPQDYQTDCVAQVVADADIIPIASSYDKFYRNHTKAYNEFNPDLTPREWVKDYGIPLLESQTFMTDTALDEYQPQIVKNLKRHREFLNDGPAKVLVGGTFDMIHEGHKELLKTAFGYGNLTIGLTCDSIANKSRERDVKPYVDRYFELEKECKELAEKYHREFNIVELNSKEDVSTTAEADIIVISPEPKIKEHVESINEKRKYNGLDELEVMVSDEVYAYDGDRISSTRIQNNEIDKNGNKI